MNNNKMNNNNQNKKLLNLFISLKNKALKKQNKIITYNLRLLIRIYKTMNKTN